MKVYIWGTGELAEKCIKDIIQDIDILGFIESVPTKEKFYGKKVFKGEDIDKLSYDYIILANAYGREIVDSYKLDEKKVIYYQLVIENDNGKVTAYRKKNNSLQEAIFKTQKKLDVMENARKIMPCIATQEEDLKFLFDHNDLLIPNEIVGYGENYAKKEIEFFYENAPKKEKGYFLDIGANVGTSSIYFRKKINDKLQYIAFEPLRVNYKYLKMNCILNDCEDIKIENVGLSNVNSKKNMYIFDGAFGSSMVVENNHQKSEQCQFITLDDYVRENEVSAKNISYIWVDVQCHELEVIEGALNTLNESDASLYIEYNVEELKRVNKNRRFIEKLMKIYKKFICYEQYAKGKTKVRDIDELPLLADEVADISYCNILLTK